MLDNLPQLFIPFKAQFFQDCLFILETQKLFIYSLEIVFHFMNYLLIPNQFGLPGGWQKCLVLSWINSQYYFSIHKLCTPKRGCAFL